MTPCIKIIYPNHGRAKNALDAIVRKSAPGRKVPRAVYPCRACHGWHLTSKNVGGSWKIFQTPVLANDSFKGVQALG
jgi:hypothetical protein